MLPKETKELKKLRDNHVFLTNRILMEVVRSAKYENLRNKKQYAEFSGCLKAQCCELVDVFKEFEGKHLTQAHGILI